MLGDALKFWGAEMAGFSDSEIKITGSAYQSLNLFWKSGSTGTMSKTPNRTWRINVNYRCENGRIVFINSVPAERNTDAWYEGTAQISIAPDTTKGLTIAAAFSGRQRTTLYSYDSARISIPKGAAITLSDSIRFPPMSEPAPKKIEPDKPESSNVLALRTTLTHTMLGPVMLATISEKGDAQQVTFTAKSNEDVAAFEDRLHQALVAYEIKTQPIWSNNAYYFTMLIQNKPAENSHAIQYSSHRVLVEMQKISHPMVDASKAIEQDGRYLVTLNVLGGVGADEIIARLKRNSSLVADAKLLSDSVSPQSAKLRVVVLSVRLR